MATNWFRASMWRSITSATASAGTAGSRSGAFRINGRAFYTTGGAPGGASGPVADKPSLLRRLWDSPIGIKTVHFWAPVMKWGLVIAGISDFARPAENLSLAQNASLTATGLIWTRWCLIIKPKNYLLAAVNFFLGMVGIVQVSRILSWKYGNEHPGQSLPEAVKEEVVELKNKAKLEAEKAKRKIAGP